MSFQDEYGIAEIEAHAGDYANSSSEYEYPVVNDEYQIGETSKLAGSSYEDAPVVMQYGEEQGIQYPCVYIRVPQGELRQHQLMVLSNLVKKIVPDTELSYPIYVEADATLSKIGTLDSVSLRTFLTSRIFSSWDVSIYRSESEVYTGDMCLAFCSV